MNYDILDQLICLEKKGEASKDKKKEYLSQMFKILDEIKSDLLKESETMDFMDLCKSMRIVDGTPEYIECWFNVL